MRLSRRAIYAVEFVAAAGLVAGAVALAQLLQLAACPLCVIQRMLFLLLALLAMIGVGIANNKPFHILVSLLSTATAATGAFVAGYQSWLQHHPTGIGCAVDSPWWERLVYWAGEHSPLLFGSSGFCEDPGWKLVGLSLAEYSLIAFVALGAFALYGLLRREH